MKKYYRIYVLRTPSDIVEIIKGYYHGKNVRATKLYKQLHDDTFYKNMYHSIGTEEITRNEFLKETNPVFKPLHTKQSEFIQKMCTEIDNGNLNIPYVEELLIRDLQLQTMYSIHDSDTLNKVLQLYKKYLKETH